MQIFDVIIFFKLRTIQQKTVKPTYLCPLGARKLAEGKGHKTVSKHKLALLLGMSFCCRKLFCLFLYILQCSFLSLQDSVRAYQLQNNFLSKEIMELNELRKMDEKREKELLMCVDL